MKSITNSFTRNLAAVAAYAIDAILLSRVAALIDVALDVAHLVAMCALALLIAASAAELAIHRAFGIRAAQGLDAHLAVFLSAGIALAFFVTPGPARSSPEKI